MIIPCGTYVLHQEYMCITYDVEVYICVTYGVSANFWSTQKDVVHMLTYVITI